MLQEQYKFTFYLKEFCNALYIFIQNLASRPCYAGVAPSIGSMIEQNLKNPNTEKIGQQKNKTIKNQNNDETEF